MHQVTAATKPEHFPDTIETFSRQMLPIIQVIYQSRLLMEKVYTSIIHDKTPISIGFNNDSQNPIPPCFQIMTPLTKKRRREQVVQSWRMRNDFLFFLLLYTLTHVQNYITLIVVSLYSYIIH
jgi:hypothetical protein